MNIKKEVLGQLNHMLEQELGSIQHSIHHNKWEIHKLSEHQRVLKSKRHEVGELIHHLNTKK